MTTNGGVSSSRASTLRASVDLAMDRAAAFDTLVDQLADGLARRGIEFEPGSNGRVIEDGIDVGRVVAWTPGERVSIEWRPAPWDPDEVTTIELRVEAIEGGTRLTLEHRGWGRLLGGPEEQAGWFAGEVVAPLLRATAPTALGDWITDRRARRPSGAQSRDVYRDPLYHYPSFRVVLAELESLARQAGFDDARVVRRDMATFAREAGVPEEHLPLFAAGEQFLIARRH